MSKVEFKGPRNGVHLYPPPEGSQGLPWLVVIFDSGKLSSHAYETETEARSAMDEEVWTWLDEQDEAEIRK